MTTPDKEEIPIDMTAGLIATAIAYLREEADFNRSWADGRRKVDFGTGSDSEGYKAHRLELALVREAWADAIEHACNAYEPMREALILAEKADRIHSKCQECEDGAQAPEACGDCFPSADDARVARRNVLKSLGVRMRDVDRARVAKAEPLTCKCSQEDVHDYGPCDEHCRSQPATAPHDEDLSRLKDALQLADGAFESIRKILINNLDEPERSAFWAAVHARDSIRAALSTLPVNDRRTSDNVGRLREALKRLLASYCTAITVLGANQFAIDTDPVIREARAALKGVPQPASEGSSALLTSSLPRAAEIPPARA